MAQMKHVIKFSTISNFFAEANERGLLAKGENAVESNRVKSYIFSPELLMLRGEVFASMRDQFYNVEVNFFKDREIKNVFCTCPRGQYLCHHVAALLVYAHYNISVTDIECRWAAKKVTEEEIRTIDDIYVTKKHVTTNRKLTMDEITTFYSSLQQFGTAVGFTWLLRPEPTMETSLLADVEDLIFSEEYLVAEDRTNYFINKMQLTAEVINKVQAATVGQSRNENWLSCRKNRLTASNFGIVLSAISRNKYPPSLFKRLMGFYNLENIKAVQWGLIHEGTAIEEFKKEMNLDVKPTGLWLDTCGFLGASPDGLVGSNAIIEVKCPYKFREKSISQELRNDRSYIIYFNDEEMMLNMKHEYYHQIQGNLAMTGRDLCYLWIWTPRENLLMEVYKDETWKQNLNLLKTFYVDQYLLHIMSNLGEDF